MSNAHPLADRVFRVAHVVALVALILAIVAGVKQSKFSDSDAIATSVSLRKATAVLLLALIIVLALATAFFASRIRSVLDGDRLLVYAAAASLPFLLIREIDIMLVAFSSSSVFHGLHQNVYVLAFMAYLMEYCAAVIFVTAGLRTKGFKKVTATHTADHTKDVELRQQETGVSHARRT